MQSLKVDFSSYGELVHYFREHPEKLELAKKAAPEFVKIVGESVYPAYEQYLKNKVAYPIEYFRPNLAQSKLIYSKNNAGEMPRSLFLEGSNKCGKSTLGVAWQISIAVGHYPWLDPKFIEGDNMMNCEYSRNWKLYRLFAEYCGFEHEREISEQFFDIKGKQIKKLKVPNINLAVGETFTESVEKDLVPKYIGGGGQIGLIPKDWKPKAKKNQQGVISKITLEAGPGKGSIFHFRSYKSAAAEFEGIDATGSILFNEPPPEDIVKAVLRGAMVADTRTMYAYTALKEPWIYRQIINKAARWLI